MMQQWMRLTNILTDLTVACVMYCYWSVVLWYYEARLWLLRNGLG